MAITTQYLIVLGSIGTLVLLLLSYLMAKLKDKTSKITIVLLIPTILCGLGVYLIGYMPESASVGDYSRSLLRAIFSTGRMFSFNDDYSAIKKSEIVNSMVYTLVFWACHVSALIIMILTFFSIFGKKLLDQMKILFKFNKDIYIIYGANTKSLSFAQNILTKDDYLEKAASDRYVLFIDENIDQQMQDKISSIGGVFINCPVFTRNSFNNGALKKAGLRKRIFLPKVIYVFAFTENDMINFNIINGILDVANKENIPEKNLKGIYIHSDSETIIEALNEKAISIKYNFNYFCEADLAARKLFETYPLYSKLAFDRQTGLPQEKKTLKILILGFGVTGKHILRKALYNGQFEGCAFEAIVIDRYMNDIQGQFKNNYPALFSESKPQYLKINFIQDNVRSDSFYELLKKYVENTNAANIFHIDYVVASLGDDNLNFEVVSDIRRFLKRQKVSQLPTLSAHIADKVYKLFNTGKDDMMGDINIFGDYDDIFTDGIIISEEMDILAKAVDSSYGGTDWVSLSTHKKNSNRAAASFMSAYLYIVGLEVKKSVAIESDEEIITEEKFVKMFGENNQLLENLGRTEHQRWNAFHYAFGWTKKSLDTVHSYTERIEESNKIHACLVPWDELTIVKNKIIEEYKMTTSNAEMESIIRRCNFQGTDRNNIFSLYRIREEYNSKVLDENKIDFVFKR